jgi:hypothetical protein
MNEEDFNLLILRYLDDGFEDTEYIAKIVNAFPFVKTSTLICNLLRSIEYETFSMTGLFLRDAILYGNRDKACHQFIGEYPESLIVKTLEELIFSDNYFIQSEAIYTLGKTCSYSSKDALSQAFDQFWESNPFLLHKLLNEMQWLGVENLERCIEKMANSSRYLTRWAAVKYIYSYTIEYQTPPDWVEMLRRDKYKTIFKEAEYEYQRALKSLQRTTLSKAEQRKRAKEIKKIEPILSFDTASSKFRNFLSQNGLSKYEVTDIEAYIDREILI